MVIKRPHPPVITMVFPTQGVDSGLDKFVKELVIKFAELGYSLQFSLEGENIRVTGISFYLVASNILNKRNQTQL